MIAHYQLHAPIYAQEDNMHLVTRFTCVECVHICKISCQCVRTYIADCMMLWVLAAFLPFIWLSYFFPTLGWRDGIDVCQWGRPQKSSGDPAEQRGYTGYASKGTTVLDFFASCL